MTRCPSLSLSGLRPMLLPASLLTALLAVLLTVPLAVPVAAAAIESPRGAVQSPDPDSLRPRAEEYWRLLISGDRAGASQFLRPEDRPAFLQGQEQAFRDPAIESIELSDDGAQATVEIAIDVLTPHRHLPLEDPAGVDRRGRRMDGRRPRRMDDRRPRHLRQPLRHPRPRPRIRT